MSGVLQSIWCSPNSGDPYFSNVVFASHFDGTNNSTSFIDIKGNTITPHGSPVISTGDNKFGGSSSYFSGANTDYLSVVVSESALHTNDLTVEFFIKFLDFSYTRYVFGNTGPGGSYILFYADTAGHPYSLVGGTDLQLNSSFSFATNTWYHIAMCKHGSYGYLFIDGNLTITSTSGNIGYSTYTTFEIGKAYNYTPSNPGLHGYIDDIRITKNIARYTSNFTPPALPFPNS